MGKLCKELWDTKKNLYNIQKHAGLGRRLGRNWKEEGIITHLRIGHTEKTGRHPTGIRVNHKQPKCVKHVLFECLGYEGEEGYSALKGANVSFTIEKPDWRRITGNIQKLDTIYEGNMSN